VTPALVEPVLPAAARPWIRRFFILGHATKGIVYLLVGGLALLAAAGQGGKVSGEDGAVRTIGEQPFGSFLLVAAGLGLFCYAAWCLFQAAFNPDGGRGAVGAGKRAGRLISAFTHGGLAITAFQLRGAGGAPDHERESREWVARVLAEPYGDALIAATGLVLCCVAAYQLYCGAVGRFPEPLDARAGARRWVDTVGRLGLAARGVVFAIIGVRLVKTGLDDTSRHARALGGALHDVAAQPYGRLLLALVAAGLAAYGIYQLVVARHGHPRGV
jgi:hypothetical protein